MVAGPGESVPNQPVPDQKTAQPEGLQSPPSSEAQPLTETPQVKWEEVLESAQKSPTEDTFYQLKGAEDEARRRQEAVVSPEVQSLVQENLLELAYLFVKKQSLLPSELESFGGILERIDPEFSQLKSLEPPEALKRCQEIIKRLMSDEQKRGQLVALGLIYQEYKFNLLQKTYGISIEEEGSEERKAAQSLTKEEETEKKEAKRKLTRDPTILVVDTEGNIVPQPVELSRDEYIKANWRNQPVPFWRKIFGDVESYQKEKAGKEWDRANEVLKKVSEGRLKEIKIRVAFDTTQSLSEMEKNFLNELGFIDESGQLKKIEDERVLEELMAQVRQTFTLRREILSVTGVSGEQLIENLLKLQSLPLTSEELKEIIQTQITKEQEEAQQRVAKELEVAVLSGDIRILEEERRKKEEELKKLEESRQREGEKPKIDYQRIYDALPPAVQNELSELEIITSNDQIGGLSSLPERIRSLEAEIRQVIRSLESLKELQQLIREDEKLILELSNNLNARKATIKHEDGREETLEPIPEFLEMLKAIKTRFNENVSREKNIRDDLSKRNEQERDLDSLTERLNRLKALMDTRFSIGGKESSLQEWLQQASRLEQSPSDEQTQKSTEDPEDKLRRRLGYLDVLIEYSDEKKLAEISIRRTQIILSDQALDNLLEAVERQNPKLSHIIKKVDADKKRDFLRNLYIIFGPEALLPESGSSEQRSQQRETAEKIIYFLESLGNLKTDVISSDFSKKIIELIRKEVGEINKPSEQKTQQVENAS